MTDLIDTANNLAQTTLDNSISNARCTCQANNVTDCEDCGEPIGNVRKQAVPWATRCINCQTKYETQTEIR